MRNRNFKTDLEKISQSCGFSSVGVLNPRKINIDLKRRFDEYIKNNWHADMKWLEKRIKERTNPQILWPEVESILVFTDDYTPNINPLKKLKQRNLANISVYASGRDYHRVVKSKLKKIGSWLVKTLDCEIKLFVDTAPVMEKPLAQMAGIGWQGKHTNLISKKNGNWFFLGFIFTNKMLKADSPEIDHCGSCTKCMDICPTNAILGPYKLDSRRCISYLTIEHPGLIEEELRPMIGNRIFGCDDCLAVCPWNKFADSSRNLNYDRRFSRLTLDKAIQFTDSDFREFFSGSAIKRLGINRFLRNVLYAIGNSKQRKYIPKIKAFSQNKTSFIADAADWAIHTLDKN